MDATLDLLGVFLLLAGFVIGLGAVTVIDLHGFLGRHSSYWTEATTRTHKVTKPLIWIGVALCVAGGAVLYRHESFSGIPRAHALMALGLVLNGLFLSFSVSPFLLRREAEGKAGTPLPDAWQRKIFVSFLVSDGLWWASLFLFAAYLTRA
ncbi:hypothetical protein EBS80_03695 [bacterium]|nr:hypothetical protein [bacterium]